MVNLLSAELLSKSYHDRWLFKDLTLGISQGDKLALVGENGAGKSTLLKILTGQVPSDGGIISLRDGVKLGYLTQEPRADDALTVNDLLFDDSNETARVVRQYEMLIHAPDAPADVMQKVLVRMDELNAWDYESKVQEVTGKLGVTDTTQKLGELSGGQRKRVFLAQLLLSNPDLIIMDEPTNHLDLEAIEWLEAYLSSQQLTVLMVTHDRYFLDNVANEILELDRGKLYRYKGNYAYFLEKKAEREEMLRTEVTKARNLLRKELEWMRKQPKARGTKAKYRIDAFYELQEKASQNLKRDKLELDIQESRQGGKVLEIDRVSKKYEDKVLVNNFSYVFKKKDRIGVVGKNGIGKSTFLDLITGALKPDSGEVIKGLTTNIGYFKQEAEDLQLNHRVIEEVKSIAEFITLADGSEVSASRFLDIFFFPPEKQYTFVEKLSGGEKKRLQLLKVLIKNPNFLILDEPTNDFDIDTLNVLEEFLEKFNGCLVLVSHDRYFMDQLVDQLFVFEGEGSIRLFNGNYSDYRLEQDALERQPVITKQVELKQPNASSEKKKGPSFKERKEYEELEAAIKQLEQEKMEIEARLSVSDNPHEQIAQMGKRLREIDSMIEQQTERWLTLSEIM